MKYHVLIWFYLSGITKQMSIYSQKLLTSPSDSCLCSSLGPFCDFRGGRSGTVIVVTDCRSWEIYPPAWHDPCSTEH